MEILPAAIVVLVAMEAPRIGMLDFRPDSRPGALVKQAGELRTELATGLAAGRRVRRRYCPSVGSRRYGRSSAGHPRRSA